MSLEDVMGYCTFVYVSVNKENVLDFIVATKENASFSVKEPGNLRFDFYQFKDDLSKFVLVEAYETEELAGKHKDTGHYAKWKETVANWMEAPRQGVRFNKL